MPINGQSFIIKWKPPKSQFILKSQCVINITALFWFEPADGKIVH